MVKYLFGKDMRGSSRCPIAGAFWAYACRQLITTTRFLCGDSRSPGPDMKPGPLEYVADLIFTRLWLTIMVLIMNRCRPARCGGLICTTTTTARQFIVIEPRTAHASYSDVTCGAPHGWMLMQLWICIMNDNTSTVVEKSEGRKEDIVPFCFAEWRHHFNLVCFRWLGHMCSKAATNFSFALVVMWSWLLNLHERAALEVNPLSDARFRRFRMCNVERLLASSCPPARPHVSAWFPPDAFSWIFILGTSTKICWGTPNMVKLGQQYRTPYMKTVLQR